MLKPRYKHQYKFSKIDKEKATVAYMISFYCRHQHTPNTLCIDCKELINYSQLRLEKCRYGNNKTACKACLTHCYNGSHDNLEER